MRRTASPDPFLNTQKQLEREVRQDPWPWRPEMPWWRRIGSAREIVFFLFEYIYMSQQESYARIRYRGGILLVQNY